METPTTAKAIVLLAQTSTAKSKKESRANTCTKSLAYYFQREGEKKRNLNKTNYFLYYLINVLLHPRRAVWLRSFLFTLEKLF